ncbi:MAG TPA: apolipoprotein N-acyltransferase [Rectinemataceae bacterium]|nr:apolipoprotein N-acyltransferase [Rectinemataceae bacterium]
MAPKLSPRAMEKAALPETAAWGRATAVAIFIVAAAEFVNFLVGPFGMPKGKSLPDFIFLLLVALYALWGAALFRGRAELRLRCLYRTPETLLVVSLVLFLISYIFASTANLSYAQRFALTNNSLHLAPDSMIQRLNSASRYLPLIALGAWVLIAARLKWPQLRERALGSADAFRVWGLPLALLSVLLFSFSFPSFASLAGLAPLAFVALLPLLLALSRASFGRAVFYGVAFGVLQAMIVNFWLGTFSLVSIQFITGLFLFEYALFMPVLIWTMRRLPRLGFLIVPAAWTAFDYLRSLGFLGYSWGMLGTTQYGALPLIQVASVTGVWGLTFLVTLVNSALAGFVLAWYRGPGLGLDAAALRAPRSYVPVAFAALLVVADAAGGAIAIRVQDSRPIDHRLRVALVQEDTDPHKNDYGATFDILRRLTDEALAQKPDLVVWSETAFVPNIRRWSAMDPAKYPLSKLVDRFLEYQKGMHAWLLTGNDDYTLSTDAQGNELRTDYNAAVLFSPAGERVETYRKVHLVPFTEYFPYRAQLPWVYDMLKNFDVYFWAPGTARTVFHIPSMSFSTPICFEDSFPDDVRRFVRNGAQVIVNLSNDYWSLSPVEGKQHYINSLFRAVENRCPLLRATSSGLTAYVDPTGRLVRSVPYFSQEYLIADVAVPAPQESPYTAWGDWFPVMLLVFVLLSACAGVFVMARGVAGPRSGARGVGHRADR